MLLYVDKEIDLLNAKFLQNLKCLSVIFVLMRTRIHFFMQE